MTIIDSKTIIQGKRSAIVLLALNGGRYEIQAVTNSDIQELYYTDDASVECFRGIRRAFRSL